MKKKFLRFAAVTLLAATGIASVVTLTSCGSDEDTATSEVANVDLSTIASRIAVTNDGDKVTEDFTLPSFVANDGVNYKITWHSNDEAHLTFEYKTDDPSTTDVDESLENVTAKIVRDTELKEVTYYGTITDGSKTAQSAEFAVRIQRLMTPKEEFEELYDAVIGNTKTTASTSGYVVKKAGTALYNGLTECCLYLTSDKVPGYGVFAYLCYIDADEYAALNEGDYVTIKNASFQNYSNVVEGCYGNVTVDKTVPALTADELAAKVEDITDLVLDDTVKTATDFKYIQGNMVTLNGAVVKSVSESYTTAAKYLTTLQTLITVDVDGEEISLCLQNGITTLLDDASTKDVAENATAAAIYKSVTETYKEGDVVNIKGILYGTANTIVLCDAADLTLAEEAPTWAKIAATEAEIEFENVSGDKEFTLAATGTKYSDVAITYAVKEGASIASITDGKLTVTPEKTAANVTITATFTVDGKTVTKDYTFSAQALTDKEKATKCAADAAAALAKTYTNSQLVALNYTATFSDVTLAYTMASGELANIVDGNLVLLDGNDSTIVVTVTAVCGSEISTDEAEITLTESVNTDAEYKAAFSGTKAAQATTTVTVKAVITGKPSSSNKIYAQSLDGKTGYYVYATPTVPAGVTLADGQIVYITGTGYTYNSQLEFNTASITPVYNQGGNISTTDTITHNEISAVTADNLKAQYNNNVMVSGTVQSVTTTSTGATVTLKDSSGNVFYVVVDSTYADKTSDIYTGCMKDLTPGYVVAVSGNVLYNSTLKTQVVVPAELDTIVAVELEDAAAVELQKSLINTSIADVDAAGTVTLTPATVKDVTVTYALDAASDYATISGNTLTVSSQPTDADVTLNITATITRDDETETQAITVKILKQSNTKKATVAYSGTTTANMDGTDQAATLGLDTTIFDATGTISSGTTNVGLNKAGDFRLYKSSAQALNISVIDGYTIDSIVINVKSGTATDLVVTAGGATVALTDGAYTIGSSSFSVTNGGTATISISSIVITYTKTAA